MLASDITMAWKEARERKSMQPYKYTWEHANMFKDTAPHCARSKRMQTYESALTCARSITNACGTTLGG